MYMKEKRYITLLGDDIEKGTIKSSIFSKDALASASVNSVVYGGIFDSETSLADMAMGTGISHLRSTFYKHSLERLFLGTFSKKTLMTYLDNETLKTICIDKSPDAKTSINSKTKYGMAIRRANISYGLMSALGPVAIATQSFGAISSGTDNSLLQEMSQVLAKDAGVLTRIFDGFNRFNKLSKGEWAIIDTPEHQEDLEEDKTYAPAMG